MAFDRFRNQNYAQAPSYQSQGYGGGQGPSQGIYNTAVSPKQYSNTSVDQYEAQSDELLDLALALSLSEDAGDGHNYQPEGHRGLNRSNSLLSFEKVWTYSNSRLPPYMPPLVLYMPTWRLMCMAADTSLTVYNRPEANEQEHYIKADWQRDTKAMILKSSPIDDQNLIVFAIRGSRMNFADWAVNFRPAPTSPAGFLDDGDNACHTGFLTVAKAMVGVVAARLRQLLQQNPSRASSSLLITGHSAGGAIASLLYAHMHSTQVESELTVLTGFFKRVHCITFGAPPISVLPLQRSRGLSRRKSVFLSIVNEGDPVVRAEKGYLLSLGRLLATPANRPDDERKPSMSKKASALKLSILKPQLKPTPAPYWQVPPATLSLAGQVVLVRRKPGSRSPTAIEAVDTSDEQLRKYVFGDPAMHPMSLYKQRVDQLAIAAVTGAPIT